MPNSEPETRVSVRGTIDTISRPSTYQAPVQVNTVLELDQPFLFGAKPDADGEFKALGDFTLFLKKEEFVKALAKGANPPCKVGSRTSIDFTAVVKDSTGRESTAPCRIHLASSFGGIYYSATFRGVKYKCPDFPSLRKWEAGTDWKKKYTAPSVDAWNQWLGPDMLGWPEKIEERNPSGGYLEEKWRIAWILHEAIFGNAQTKAAGLVLVTGATGSGKTTLLNLVIGQYMCQLFGDSPPERRPHIVAVGDPVETTFLTQKEENTLRHAGDFQREAAPRAFDYTVRLLGVDAPSVASALRDALRETPAAYIVSELRDDEDIRATLDFAATGHLVFATAHSTSLVDSMARLMRVADASTPNGRAALAQRLRSVVHIRPFEVAGCDVNVNNQRIEKTLRAALPTIWRGNTAGIRSFVADGLASLLPRGVSAFDGAAAESSVLGLSYTARKLMDIHGQCDPGKGRCHYRQLLRRAHALDLETR